MNIHPKISDSLKLIPMKRIDKRLWAPSKLKQIEASQKHMPPIPGVFQQPVDTNVNIRRDKVPLSDSLVKTLEEALDAIDNPNMSEPDTLDTGSTPAPLPKDNNYTIDMAKSQLDGILGKWKDLEVNYPIGDQRNKFTEIGQRLGEISRVIQRDFIDGGSSINQSPDLNLGGNSEQI